VTWHRWLLDALSGMGAVIAAYCGVVLMWGVASIGLDLVQHQTGGIGAVSGGLSEALLLGLIACVLLNRLLAKWARRLGGVVLTLHRAHTVTFAAGSVLLALLVLSLLTSLVPAITVIAGFLLVGTLLAVQFLLLSTILIAWIWRRRLAPRAA
jgi:hypothetical protein